MAREWLVALCLVLLLDAGAMAQERQWQRDLAREIRGLLDCQVAFLSHVVEREIEGREVVMAKVHCLDQRSFDAVRHGATDRFEFKECTRESTQTC